MGAERRRRLVAIEENRVYTSLCCSHQGTIQSCEANNLLVVLNSKRLSSLATFLTRVHGSERLDFPQDHL